MGQYQAGVPCNLIIRRNSFWNIMQSFASCQSLAKTERQNSRVWAIPDCAAQYYLEYLQCQKVFAPLPDFLFFICSSHLNVSDQQTNLNIGQSKHNIHLRPVHHKVLLVPFTTASHLGPEAAKQLQTVTRPPPYFMVGMMFLFCNVMLLLRQM